MKNHIKKRILSNGKGKLFLQCLDETKSESSLAVRQVYDITSELNNLIWLIMTEYDRMDLLACNAIQRPWLEYCEAENLKVLSLDEMTALYEDNLRIQISIINEYIGYRFSFLKGDGEKLYLGCKPDSLHGYFIINYSREPLNAFRYLHLSTSTSPLLFSRIAMNRGPAKEYVEIMLKPDTREITFGELIEECRRWMASYFDFS